MFFEKKKKFTVNEAGKALVAAGLKL